MGKGKKCPDQNPEKEATDKEEYNGDVLFINVLTVTDHNCKYRPCNLFCPGKLGPLGRDSLLPKRSFKEIQMTHHHNHHHHHDHDHEIVSTLSFYEKIIKLLEHWVKHNDDHAGTYRDWAKKAKEKNMDEAGSLLEDAAEMTLEISKKFEEAARIIRR
jgi:hypothetical protein